VLLASQSCYHQLLYQDHVQYQPFVTNHNYRNGANE